MAQELEDLLIKVESELGDLSGIDSAVGALNSLAQFSAKASSGANSLEKMASALTQLNAFGKSKINTQKTVKDITALKGALETLADFTKDANKSIKQLKSLGGALGAFTDIGKNLAGINDVVKGIERMVDVLDKLSKVEKDASKGIKGVRDLGSALHSFNGLDDNVKALNDISLGLINLGKATESLKGYKKGDFDFLSKIGTSLGEMSKAMDGTTRIWSTIGDVTKGITGLIQALKNTENINVGHIGAIADELKKFNDPAIKGNAHVLDVTLAHLTNTLTQLNQSSSMVHHTMRDLVDGFKSASDGFYNVRSSVEAIATDFTDALKPVRNSDLFDTLEKFKHLNDSYKNVGGLGQGLGSLISALDMLNGRDLQTYGLTQILEYFQKLANTSLIDDASKQMEKVGNLAQPIASLVNALKYTDFDEKNNVLTVLGDQINKFYNKLPNNFDKLSYVMYALRDLIQLASDAKAFGVEIPEDNVISQIGKSLAGFKDLPNVKEIATFIQAIHSLVTYLTSMQESLKHTSGGTKGSYWEDAIDVTPIVKVAEALKSLQGLGQNLASFKTFRDTLMSFMRFNTQNLNGVNLVLEGIFETMQKIPEGRGDTLKGLASSIRALDKLQNIDPNQLMLIADGLTKIMTALGGIQGSNNRISIRLDSSGVANFKQITQETRRTWDDFYNQLEEDLKNIDMSSMFDLSAPLNGLKKQLNEAERMLHQRMKTMYEENAKMQQSRQTNANYEDSRTFQTQASKFARAKVEAQQLKDIIEQINKAMLDAPRFGNDAEGHKYLHSLREEYERYQKFMERFNRGADADPSTHIGHVFEVVQERMEYLKDEIARATENLDEMETTLEGVAEEARLGADELERMADEAERASQEMRGNIGEGFGKFGSMLTGSKNGVLSSFGNLSNMFGKAVKDGTAVLGDTQLASLEGFAGTLGTVATAVGQVGAVIGVVVAVFKAWWDTMEKVKDTLVKFVQSCAQFAKNMLTTVVGAFNAVAGAVSKVVSAVRSGAEAIVVALRKIRDFGSDVISFFGKLGNAFAPAVKGIKAVLSAVTPRFVKTLASSNFQLSKLIKQTHLLKNAVKAVQRYFSMLTRMLARKSITAFLNQMKQAFEDMVLFERNSNDAMLQLNYNVSIVFSEFRRLANQVIAIFEPLMNALAVPAQSFLATLTAMAENMAKFMAIMTGQPYYLRAKRFYEDYGKNLDETAKKAKNLTNGLDELNILNDKKDESGGIEPWMEFEKVDIDQMDFGLPSLAEIVDKIVDFLSNIDWQKIYDKIREIIHRIMEYVNYILSRIDLWEWLGTTLGNLFNALMVAWNQFITDFDPVATENAISAFIVKALQAIDWELIHDNVEKTAKKFAQLWNEVFADDALWSEITKFITNALNEITHYFDTWAWTFNFSQMAQTLTDAVTRILQGFDWEQLRHAVEGWVRGLVNFINTTISNKAFWRTLGDSIENVINDVIIEAFTELAKLDLVGLSDSLKQMIQHALDGIKWDDLTNSFREFATKLANAINNFFGDEEFLTQITTAIANFANAIIWSIDDFITNLKGYDIGKAISEALQKGLGTVDWNTIFKLPADALNALTNALRGLFDSIPDDFSLANWLIEHLSLTYDSINWDGLMANLYEIGDRIVRFINDVIQSDDFWSRFGDLSVKALNLVVKVTEDLTQIDWQGLGERIRDYINYVISQGKIGQILANLGNLVIDIVFSITTVITGVDWGELGKQIADGISKVIDRIYANRAKFKQDIIDAFTQFSSFMSSMLRELLKNRSFEKFGTAIGEFLLGIISGVAIFFEENTGNIVEAMKQFGDSLAKYINEHRNEIVKALNAIIDAITEILEEFFDERGKLWKALNSVIERLHLKKLINAFVQGFVKKLIEKFFTYDAIWRALEGISGIVEIALNTLWTVIKDFLWENIKKTAKDFLDNLWKAPFELTGGGLIGLIQKLFGIGKNGEVNAGGIFDNLKFTGLENAWKKFKSKLEGLKEWFKKKWEGIKDFFGGLFGGKETEVPVTFEPKLKDDTKHKLEDVTKDVELQFEDASLGKITATTIEVEKFKGKKLEIEEILAETLTVIDIFADKLHVKEIDGDMSGATTKKDMDKLWGDNSVGAQGGSLSKDLTVENIFAQLLDVKKILSELLEVGKKIVAPLLEVSEKITTPLIDAKKITTKLLDAKKITTKLLEAEKMWTKLLEVRDEILTQELKVEKKTTTKVLEVGEIDLKSNTLGGLHADLQELEKIVTQLIEALKIVASEFEVESMGLQTLKVITFTAKELNIDAINAQTLNLGQIIANTLRVGSIVSGGGLGLTNVVDNGYNEHGGSYRIEKPQFAQDDRWSDISGLIPSAEDFLKGFDDVYEGVYKGVYDSFEQTIGKATQPIALSGNGVTAVTDTLRMNGSGASQQVDDMTLPANAQYIKDYLTRAIGNEKGALGLMGNLYAESKLLPNNLQSTASDGGVNQKDIDYTNAVNKGANFIDNKGYGLAQWTTSDRKKKLLDSLGGRSVDDLQGQLEYLVKELQTDFPNVWKQLQNAQSIHDASSAVLKGFEKPKNSGLNEDALRWHYGETLGRTLDGTTIPDEPVPMDDSPRDDNGLYDGFDEAHVVDVTDDSGENGLTGTPFAFLETLPIQTEFIMARVYNIIDKWLGRIYRLFESFKVDKFLKDLLELDEIEVNLKGKLDIFDGIEKTLKEILKQLKKLIKDGIECHCDCKCDEGKSPYDPIVRALHDCGFPTDDTHLINNTKAKSDNTKAIERLNETLRNGIVCHCNCNCGDKSYYDDFSRALHDCGFPVDNTHLINNTKAKSDNTKAIERLTDTLRNGIECHCSCNCGDIGDKVADAIRSVQTKLVEVKCDCNCGGNCGNCAMGQSTRDVRPTPNYPDNTVAPTGGVINRDGTGDGGNGGYSNPNGGTGNNGWNYPSPSGGTGNSGWNYPSGGTGNSGWNYPSGGTGNNGWNYPNPSGGTGNSGWNYPSGGTGNTGGTGRGSDTKPIRPTGTTGGTGGGGKTNPVNPSGSTGDKGNTGNRIYWQNPDGSRATMYALINGQKVMLTDDLSPALKNAIASGMYPIVDKNGTPLSPKDRSTMLNYLKKKGWLNTPTNGGEAKGGKNNRAVYLHDTDGTEKLVKALVDGKEVTLTDDLPDNLKQALSNGLGENGNKAIFTVGGRQLNPEEVSALLDHLKNKGWTKGANTNGGNAGKSNNTGNGTSGNGTSGNGKGTSSTGGKSNVDYDPDTDISLGDGKGCEKCDLKVRANKCGLNLFDKNGNFVGWKQTKKLVEQCEENKRQKYKKEAQAYADKIKNSKLSGASKDKAQSLLNSINNESSVDKQKDLLNQLKYLADDADKAGSNDSQLADYKNQAKQLADKVNKGISASADQIKNAQNLLDSINKATDPSQAKNALDKLQSLANTVGNNDNTLKGYQDKAKSLANSINGSGVGTDAQKKQANDLLKNISNSKDPKSAKASLDSLQGLSDTVKGNENAINGYKDKAKSIANSISGSKGGTKDQKKQAQDLLNSISNAKDPKSAKASLDKLQNLSDEVTKADSKQQALLDEFKRLISSPTWDKIGDHAFRIWHDGVSDYFNKFVAQYYGYNMDAVTASSNIEKLAFRGAGSSVSNGWDKFLYGDYAVEAWNYWYQNSRKVKGYASGGFPTSGDFFLANEGGDAEYIGSYGRKTTVANNQQIVTAVSDGVARAVSGLYDAIDKQTEKIVGAVNQKNYEFDFSKLRVEERVKSTLDKVDESLNKWASNASQTFDRIGTSLNELSNKIDITLGNMTTRFGTALDTLATKLDSTLGDVASRVGTTLDNLANGATQTFDKVGNALDSLANGATQAFDKVGSSLGNLANGATQTFDKVGASLNNLANGATQTFDKVGNSLNNLANGATQTFGNVGTALNNLANGATQTFGKVGNSLDNLANGATQTFGKVGNALDSLANRINAQSAPTGSSTAGSGTQPKSSAPTTSGTQPASSAPTTDDSKYESNENYREIKRIRDKVVNSPYSVKAQKDAIENLLNNQKLAINDGRAEGAKKDYYKDLAQTFDKIVDEQENNPLKNIYYNGQSIESLVSTEEGKRILGGALGSGLLAKNLKKDGAKMSDGSGIPYSGKKEALDANTANSIIETIKSRYGVTPSLSGIGLLPSTKANIDAGHSVSIGIGNTSVSFQKDQREEYRARQVEELNKNINGELKSMSIGGGLERYWADTNASGLRDAFDYWYNNRFLVKGYQMGGMPNAGEMFVARENGTPEYVGSFGNKTAVANNDQIVTAVANGVSMANDRVVNAIQSQTESLSNTIDRKDLNVQIGDRQIAEANNRGQRGLGNKFVE